MGMKLNKEEEPRKVFSEDVINSIFISDDIGPEEKEM